LWYNLREVIFVSRNQYDFQQFDDMIEEVIENATVQYDGPSVLDNSERSASALEAIQAAIEQDRNERIQAEKSAKRWQIAGLIVGVLTLIATVVFGLLTVLG